MTITNLVLPKIESTAMSRMSPRASTLAARASTARDASNVSRRTGTIGRMEGSLPRRSERYEAGPVHDRGREGTGDQVVEHDARAAADP